MKIIICKPGKLPEQRVIREGLNLRMMQQIVEGQIEVVHADGLPQGVVIVCNEDGKQLDLVPNRWISRGGVEDLLCGTFFVCGVDVVDEETGEKDLVPLTDAETAKIAAQLGNGILAAAFHVEAPAEKSKAEARPTTVGMMIERIAERICDDICKYQDEIDADERLIDKYCGACPLNLLV